MATARPTLAAIGCTGPVSHEFVQGFLQQDIQLRILARRPEQIAARFPTAEVVAGSMSNPDDVARVVEDVDAAFVMTPMGMRDQAGPEVEIAKAVIAGAKAGQLKHFIYTSVLGAERARGVGILDAKCEIEQMLASSGLPYTLMRCGSYMEDVFDPRLALLNKGIFLFPINKERRFAYTSQRDVPRFIAQELLAKSQVLNRSFNFIAPGTYSVREVEALLSQARGKKIRAPAKFPLFYLFLALKPYFNWVSHRFSSVVPLMEHFDKHGYTDASADTETLFPSFRMTTLEEHLGALWPENAAVSAPTPAQA
ncbi:MAG: hypothetical protein Tsb0020_13950 [Haliangiales bacterium]